MLRNGFGYAKDPILKPLSNIETRDALIDWSDPENPTEADWPDADVVIGNPPFLGGKLLRRRLGDGYVDLLFRVYHGRVPREGDFVTYWHEKARAMVGRGTEVVRGVPIRYSESEQVVAVNNQWLSASEITREAIIFGSGAAEWRVERQARLVRLLNPKGDVQYFGNCQP